ncbi:MAG: ERF family protein [Magnetococcus sp. WYHC-3]
MRSSEQINELAKALSIAQGQMKAAKKSEKNPYFKSSYADLANVVENDRKILTDNGLSVIQGAGFGNDDDGEALAVYLTTRLMHSSGQWIEETAGAIPKDFLPQSVGATITYLRRYGYMGMVGATAEGEDDDGETAQGRTSDRKELAKDMKGPPSPTVPNEKNSKNPIDEDKAALRERFDRVRNSGHFTQAEIKEMNAKVSKVKDEMPSIEFLVGRFEMDLKDRESNQKKSMDAIFEANVENPGR